MDPPLVNCAECGATIPVHEFQAHSVTLHGGAGRTETYMEMARRIVRVPLPEEGAGAKGARDRQGREFLWHQFFVRLTKRYSELMEALYQGDADQELKLLGDLHFLLMYQEKECVDQIKELQGRHRPKPRP